MKKEKEMIEEEVSEGNKILKEQLEFYKKNNVQIHIKKNDGRYYNGDILEIQGDLLILDDRILGGMPIHFIEIETLEKFTPREAKR